MVGSRGSPVLTFVAMAASIYTWWALGLFAMHSLSLFYYGNEIYLHERLEAQNFCDICMAEGTMQKIGKYGLGCYEACDYGHTDFSPLRARIFVLVNATHSCGYRPCKDVVSDLGWPMVLCVCLVLIIGMVFSMRSGYNLMSTPAGESDKPWVAEFLGKCGRWFLNGLNVLWQSFSEPVGKRLDKDL